jgi:hypothetical protein
VRGLFSQVLSTLKKKTHWLDCEKNLEGGDVANNKIK